MTTTATGTRDGAALADERRTYVVDTSVLLSDPRAPLHFAEHEVVLPLVVVTELESKRADPDLGHTARAALRLLDELRRRHGHLDRPVPLTAEGGTLRVELNHVSTDVLPLGIRGTDNDARILAVAAALAEEGADVTVVSKDLPMRVKAAAIGLAADEYRHELVRDSGWRGLVPLDVADAWLDGLYEDGQASLAGLPLQEAAGSGIEVAPGDPAPTAERLPVNTGLRLASSRGGRSGPRAGGRRGADRPRGPGGVRPAWAVRGPAVGPGPAAGPERRDRVPGSRRCSTPSARSCPRP